MSAGTRRHQVVVVVALFVLAVIFIYTQSIDEEQGAPVSRPVAVETPAVQTATESEPEPVTKSEPEPEPEKAPIPASPQAPPIAVPARPESAVAGTPADKSIKGKEDVEGEIAVGPCDGGGKTPEGVSSQRDKDSAHTGYTSSGGKPCIDIGSVTEDVKLPGVPASVVVRPAAPPPPGPPVAGPGGAKP